MEITETALAGVFIITPKVFADARGYFFESHRRDKFADLGLNYDFMQDNCSFSKHGTIRGLHYQNAPHAQTKLVSVPAGRIIDVAVDLRKESATFGRHLAVELSSENHRALLIPKGLAHGFSVISESAAVMYKCDDYYAPSAEGSINWADPDLAIDWQIDKAKAIVSGKDQAAPSWRSFAASL